MPEETTTLTAADLAMTPVRELLKLAGELFAELLAAPAEFTDADRDRARVLRLALAEAIERAARIYPTPPHAGACSCGSQFATLEELDEHALIQILTEPKNALIKQYQRLFHMEGVELEIRTPALGAVAKKALARKTGARGLRSILETVLLDTMYELPTLENVSKVVVDEQMISADGKPLLIYSDQQKVAGGSSA